MVEFMVTLIDYGMMVLCGVVLVMVAMGAALMFVVLPIIGILGVFNEPSKTKLPNEGN